MKKILPYIISVAFILFVAATYPYTAPMKAYPFVSGNDTLGGLTSVDTVEWQFGHSELNAPASWNQLSTYITATNRTSEQTVIYQLASETGWGYSERIRIRIKGPDGTLTSPWLDISQRLGALTLYVQPDTITGDTTLYKVRLTGQ